MVLTPAAIAIIILLIICSLIFGILIGKGDRPTPDGFFLVNTTNPDKDVFTLELACPIGEIPTKKYVIFEVKNISSQEKPFA